MRRAVAVAAASVLCVVGLLSACGGGSSSDSSANPNTTEQNQAGDIPDNQAFVPYQFSDGSFTVSVPEGWSRTADGGTVTFTDKYNSVSLSTRSSAAAPTVESVRRDELPAIEGDVAGYQAGTVESVSRRAGDAVRITYRADSPPESVTGRARTLDVERYEFFHDGTEIVVTLSGPKGADNVDPWRTVTDSVQFGASAP